jgi:hypothetical protein
MKLLAMAPQVTNQPLSEVETVLLSPDEYEVLDRARRELNPDMPMEFAGPHIIRALIDRLEQSTPAPSPRGEDEVTRPGPRRARPNCSDRRRARRF